MFNPFDCHSRLQALVNKCKAQADLLYVAPALQVLAVRRELTALTVAEIRGNSADAGKGLVDLLLYTRTIKQAALKQGRGHLSHSPDAVSWVWGLVAQKTTDHSTWAKADGHNADLAWRAGRSRAEIQWLRLMLDLAFRKTNDLPLELALKVG